MQVQAIHVGASLDELVKRFGGDRVHKIMARTLNREARPVRTQVVNALTPQTGLPRGVLLRAVRETKAGSAGLEYRLRSQGGDVRLKFFKARETAKGVSAAPWNARKVYARTFIKGGRFPNRVALKMGGNVFIRAPGARRFPIKLERSGLYIPEEMIQGASLRAWTVTSNRIGARVAAEVLRQLVAGA